MKKIVAIIKPSKLEEVTNALREIGIKGMTVSEVKGYGRLQSYSELYRGSEYVIDLIPKIKIEIVVSTEEYTDKAMRAITSTVKTGKIGDGKIFVNSIDSVLRIRTDEVNTDAL